MLIIAAVYTCFLHTRTVISFLLVKNHDLKELWDVRAIHVVWWPCMSAGHTCGLVVICIYWPYTCHSKPVLFVTFRCSFLSTSTRKLVFCHCVTSNHVTTWLQLACEIFQLVGTQQHAVVVISVLHDLTVEITVHHWLEPVQWICQRFLCE